MTATTLNTRLGHEHAAFATHQPTARLLRTLTNIALFFAAPFIGLAFIVLLPFIGLVTLATVEMTTPAAHR